MGKGSKGAKEGPFASHWHEISIGRISVRSDIPDIFFSGHPCTTINSTGNKKVYLNLNDKTHNGLPV